MPDDKMPGRQVSVLGLGTMGTALAGVLLDAGYAVTVWNRSAERAAVLVGQGATLAPSAAMAIAASPISIMCFIDFPASNSVLLDREVEAAARGKALVQLTTGQGVQARQQADWARRCEASYLAGGIQGWPRDIGKPDTLFIYGGDRACFNRYAALLSVLGGDTRYLGGDAGLASIVSLALGSVFVGGEIGFFEGAALSVASGARIEDYASMALKMLGLLDTCIRDAARRILTEDYRGDQATIDVYAAGKPAVEAIHKSAGVQSKIRDAYYSYLSQAQQAGNGGQDIAALFKVVAGS